jgi:hypothetical protein
MIGNAIFLGGCYARPQVQVIGLCCVHFAYAVALCIVRPYLRSFYMLRDLAVALAMVVMYLSEIPIVFEMLSRDHTNDV